MSKHIKFKSDSTVAILDKPDVSKDLEIINSLKGAGKDLLPENVLIFPMILCDNEIDGDKEKMTDAFLNDVALSAPGLTILKDHDWLVDNQVARIFKAEVIESVDEVNKIGESLKSVVAHAYTITSKNEIVNDIEGGILKEGSLSSENMEDRCSICNVIIDGGHQKNVNMLPCGHILGNYYTEGLCYVNVDKLNRLLEYSFVAVPCQEDAGITNKVKGGKFSMKKSKFMLARIFKSKAFSEADEDTKAKLKEASEVDDSDITEDDIDKLIEENAKLKELVESLTAESEAYKSSVEKEKFESKLSSAIDLLNPLAPVVKENMMRDADYSKSMEETLADLKTKYKDLIHIDVESPESHTNEKVLEDAVEEVKEDSKEKEADKVEEVADIKSKEEEKVNEANEKNKSKRMTFGVSDSLNHVDTVKIKSRSIKVY